MPEIIARRTRTGKTHHLGGRRFSTDVSMRAIHYKDNYQDRRETWKDIDLTWEGNRITKAPYELTVDGAKITFRDKETGEVTTIERLSPDIAFRIVPRNEGVSFRHSIDTLPFVATFRVTGKAKMKTRAFDDDGEIDLETELRGGILTERISVVRDKRTHEVRPMKGLIRIDPSIDVSITASSDDAYVYENGSAWVINLTDNTVAAGYFNATFRWFGGGMRFLNLNIPVGATIENGTKIVFECRNTRSGNDCNSIFVGELSATPATFSNIANYQARRGTIVGGANDDNITTASVLWNAIPTQTAGVSYDSPELKTIVQEIVDLGAWQGDATDDMVIFWDDHGGNSTPSSTHLREMASWDDSLGGTPPSIHVEYTSGWAGGNVDGVAVAIIGKINGVAIADIAKVSGVA